MTAAIPSILSALLPIALSALGGLGGKNEKFGSTYSKGAQNTLSDLIMDLKSMKGGAQDINQNQNYQTGQDYLQSLFNDPNFFQKFEAPLQRQFSEQTIPELANRFSGMGSGGALNSGAFQRQLGREGERLHENIAALRGGMQQQAAPQLLGYAQQPFSNYMSLLQQALTPTQNTYQPANSGLFGPTGAALTGGMSQGVGQYAGQQLSNILSGIGKT